MCSVAVLLFISCVSAGASAHDFLLSLKSRAESYPSWIGIVLYRDYWFGLDTIADRNDNLVVMEESWFKGSVKAADPRLI